MKHKNITPKPMENNNPHNRVGTFCEKCRNVMCICKPMENKAPLKIYISEYAAQSMLPANKVSVGLEPIFMEDVCYILESEHNRITTELQTEIDRLKAENEWISVEDRLPEFTDNKYFSDYVLFIDKYGDISIGCYCKTSKFYKEGFMKHGSEETEDDITHWRPLPNKPKDL